MAPPVNSNGSTTQKEEELSGFIFMCSGVTKPECYLNRVFGLPAGRREVVEKIKPGTKLFLFDFDAKLLYGVYEAASKGGMNLQPSAFGGRFPAQVQFKICNDCLPLPVSSLRTAIKDNYQGSKFTPELNAQQVRDLLLLFKPIVAPSTTSLHPAVAYAAPETQMLALAPNGALRPWMQPQTLNGVPGPRMPPPASNGRLNPSLTRYSQNRYRPYQVGPLRNRSQQITQPQFVLKNELNPHLHRPYPYTPHLPPPAPVNPYQFAENRPPYLSNEPYSRCDCWILKAMEDQRSFNSPRRTLSYSRNRGATFSVFEADNKASGVGVSGEHGPNPSEVYGFVGAISTVVATVIFMIWAYIPDPWLHSIGIFYYPSKYWALALPAYAIVTAATIFLFYIGLNFMATPPTTSLNSIYDENSKDPVCFDPALDEDDRPIEPYSDIGIDQINELMFKDWK